MALDPKDPRAQRILKERAMVAEDAVTDEEQRLVEEEALLAKRLKIAESLGLDEAEKEEFLAKDGLSLRDTIKESTASVGTLGASPSPITTLNEMKGLSKNLSASAVTEPKATLSALPTKGQGPIADNTLYGQLIRDKTAVPAPAPGLPAKEAKPIAPPTPIAAVEEPEAPKTKSLMDRLQEERTEAKAEREAATKKADIGELASIIGRGLSQIGAAASGMRSGFDMSNIAKESLIDWDKRRDQIMSTYKQNISEIDSQQAKLERAQDRADDQAEKEQYRRQQLKLEYDKMKQNADIAAARLDVDVLAAIAKRDEKALAANEKKIGAELADLDKQEAALRKVEELDVEGKNIKVVAGEIAKLYGKGEAEKPGFLYGTNLKSKDEIKELIALKKQEIEGKRQAALKRRGTLTSYQQAETPAATPAAPAPAPTTGGAAKQLSMAQVQAVATRDRLTTEAAKQKLTSMGYTITE